MPALSSIPLIHNFVKLVERDIDLLSTDEPLSDNLTKKQRTALNALQKDTAITIKPSDKGGNIVVLNTKDYVDECQRLLRDHKQYSTLRFNPTEMYKEELFQILIKAKGEGIINQREFDFLFVKFPKTATFYSLPKLHKNKLPPPGRPIISGMGSLTEKISQYVDFCLRPYLLNLPSYIKDTLDVLKKLNDITVSTNTLLVAIDVESLYSSIPHDKGIEKNHPSIRSVCQANGKWSNVDWQCQPVDCGPPEDIDMGTVTFNQTTYDMTIKYSCISEYYRMILDQPGDGTYHCSSEGIWVDSLGREKLPKCEAVCGVASNPLVSMSRIFGGSNAAPGNFPWMIRFHNPNFGGGALISDQWILTAAHVMQDNDNPKMYGGLINLRKRYKHLLEAKNVFIHPHFNLNAETTKNYNNDIALVQLIRKVKMGPCISPICLPQKGASSSLQPGKIGYIAGWGMTESSNQDWARDLLYASIPISRLDKCSSIKDAVLTENMMCAGDLGKDSCSGDSGGPFMFEDPQDPNRQFVGGIVSWGPPICGNFGLYTKVENYLDWIEETIRDNEDEEENEPYDVCA
ncbi:complement C1s subcomponent-like [Bombina bombina]|uniref:complement C1s subcomponent-like n=1 Tax=Bombina bombina TaxID=8345 RepID=UPI00235AC1E1|nr:complement C1s subcomponent-like [Bombina bombina]